MKVSLQLVSIYEMLVKRCFYFFASARAAYGEIDASEGRRLRKRPEPKESPQKKPYTVSFSCYKTVSSKSSLEHSVISHLQCFFGGGVAQW